MEKFEEIIWHDPAAYYPENNYIYERLSSFAKTTRFTDCLEANNYIQNQNVKICVITSGKNGKELVQTISSMNNIISIIIFCASIEYHKAWSSEYNKVQLVTSNYRSILLYLANFFSN